MYLSISQHDDFRTLLMAFEIPYRAYIAEKIINDYTSSINFRNCNESKKRFTATI